MDDTKKPLSGQPAPGPARQGKTGGLTCIAIVCVSLALAALGAMYALDCIGMNRAEQALHEWRQNG